MKTAFYPRVIKLVRAFLIALAPISTVAAPGDLDTSFGGTGKVLTTFGFGEDFGRAVAVQPDGKLIVAGFTGSISGGSLALVRFDTNNVLDTSFGSGGKVVMPLSEANNASAVVSSLQLQSDGRIVLAGEGSDGT